MPTDRNTTASKPSKGPKRLLLAAAVVAGVAAVPIAASAQSGTETSRLTLDGFDNVVENSTAGASTADNDTTSADPSGGEFDLDNHDEEYTGDWPEPSADELADIQAIEEELAQLLDEAGIAYEWFEADGLRFIDFDEVDETAWQIIDDFFNERFPLSDEEIAFINAETEALLELLNEAGVEVTVITTDNGLIEFEITGDDASLEAADEVLADFFGHWSDTDWDVESIEVEWDVDDLDDVESGTYENEYHDNDDDDENAVPSESHPTAPANESRPTNAG